MAEGARSSLQRRLFGWLLLPLVLALPLLGAALYEQVQSSAQSWLDEGLEESFPSSDPVSVKRIT